MTRIAVEVVRGRTCTGTTVVNNGRTCLQVIIPLTICFPISERGSQRWINTNIILLNRCTSRTVITTGISKYIVIGFKDMVVGRAVDRSVDAAFSPYNSVVEDYIIRNCRIISGVGNDDSPVGVRENKVVRYDNRSIALTWAPPGTNSPSP